MPKITRETIDRINRAIQISEYLEYSPKSKLYCCPFCGSGHGPNRTGTLKIYPAENVAECFGMCKEGGKRAKKYSLIDVVEEREGLGFVDAVKHIAERSGEAIEYETGSRASGSTKSDSQQAEKVEELVFDPPEPRPNTEGKFRNFIEGCRANLEGSEEAKEYLKSRGLSEETIREYRLGYSPNQYFPSAGRELPAIIFPYNRGDSYYSARSIEGKHFYKPNSEEAGDEPLFNPEAITSEGPIFVCEGALDALAIIEAGGEAVGLIGTAWGKLPPELELWEEFIHRRENFPPLILCFDNDPPDEKGRRPGPEAQRAFAGYLAEKRFPFSEARFRLEEYSGPAKDPNDLIRSNRFQFCEDIEANIRIAEDRSGVEEFLFSISTEKYKPIPTGLWHLDSLLKGGVIPQTLILLGAEPGAGKTALGSMMFEGLAEGGAPCLFFNFEMARDQLIARSLSRRIYINDHKYKLTALDILRAYDLSETSLRLVKEAAAEYREKVAPNLQYNPLDGVADLDRVIKYINDAGEEAQRAGRPAPHICIDYLHLLTGEPGEDGPAILKRAVFELKQYAQKYNAVVLAIMAQSRNANRQKGATMDAGRDTSALEYSGDMLLQLVREDKDKPGEVSLCVTKSRFTQTNYQGDKYILHGGQSYLEPVSEWSSNPSNNPF